MTLDPKLQDLLDALPEPQRLNFPALLDAIYAVRFTGSYTVHCQEGLPKQIHFGPPIRLTICEADPPAAAKGVDTNGARRAG